MTHQWHDTYHHRQTPAHHLDPRSKLFVGVLFILVVLLTPRFTPMQAAGYPAMLLTAVVLSGVSIKTLSRRFLTLLPLVGLMLLSSWFSDLPPERWLQVMGKALCSTAALSLVMLTTPFPDMLRALEQMRSPRLIVLFLGFLYRYGGVLYEDSLQLQRAWTARYFGRHRFRQVSHLGYIVAALFIRSYERAERVFAAMQARGFSHGVTAVQVLHFSRGDGIFVLSSATVLGLLLWSPVR